MDKERECPICHKKFIANRINKICCSANCSSKMYYQKNKEASRKASKKYDDAHKKERKEYNKKYYEKHKEQLRKKHKEWYYNFKKTRSDKNE